MSLKIPEPTVAMKAAEWEVRAVEIRELFERALDAAELDAEEHDLRRSLIDAATKNPFRGDE
jgi:hypothetical protein